MLARIKSIRGAHVLGLLVMIALLLAVSGQTWAAEADAATAATQEGGGITLLIIWLVAFAGSLAALVQAFVFYKWVRDADPGNERMVEIAGYVREGANAYLRQQYIVVAGFFVVIVALLAVAAFGLNVQSKFVPFAFLTGGFFSGLAGWFGMKTATWPATARRPVPRNRSTRACRSPFARAP